LPSTAVLIFLRFKGMHLRTSVASKATAADSFCMLRWAFSRHEGLYENCYELLVNGYQDLIG
jgi:hypothetical protein